MILLGVGRRYKNFYFCLFSIVSVSEVMFLVMFHNVLC